MKAVRPSHLGTARVRGTLVFPAAGIQVSGSHVPVPRGGLFGGTGRLPGRVQCRALRHRGSYRVTAEGDVA